MADPRTFTLVFSISDKYSFGAQEPTLHSGLFPDMLVMDISRKATVSYPSSSLLSLGIA